MLQLAQDTIQYTVGFEMHEDTPAPERLRLETALKLLTERCSALELFLQHIPKIYVRLRQFYDRVGWTIPSEDRVPPTREWTAQLVKCCRCQVLHAPVSLVCTPILGVYTPTPTAAQVAAHEPQRNDAATASAVRNPTTVPPPTPFEHRMGDWVRYSMNYVQSQQATQRVGMGATAPATRNPNTVPLPPQQQQRAASWVRYQDDQVLNYTRPQQDGQRAETGVAATTPATRRP